MLTAHATSSTRDVPIARPTVPLRVLVGSSGEPSSTGAIRIASALAARAEVQVHLVAAATPVVDPPVGGGVGLAPAVANEDHRREALDAATKLLVRVPAAQEWNVRSVVGWPAESILDEAKHWGASLIVIGIGRHRVIDRFSGAETAVAIARRSDVPVMAVPADAPGLPMRVVAAIDFSEPSKTAARIAATFMPSDGTLVLTHVSSIHAGNRPSMIDRDNVDSLEALETLAAELRRPGGPRVHTHVMAGDVAEALLRFAREEHCDMIAVGGQARRMVDGVIFGSVRTKLLRDGSGTVLIAPQARRCS
jgi:nucleotide-binding universal stress UspA family protein